MAVIETVSITCAPNTVVITVDDAAGGTLNWTDPATGGAQSIPYTFANSRALALAAREGLPLTRYALFI